MCVSSFFKLINDFFFSFYYNLASCPRHMVPKPLMPTSQSIPHSISHHTLHPNKFSYPPIIKPLMPIPTLPPAAPMPPVILHHSSFKPIHVDRTGQNINGNFNNNNHNNVNSNQNNPNQHPYLPFWSYESADLQPTANTNYKPIISGKFIILIK